MVVSYTLKMLGYFYSSVAGSGSWVNMIQTGLIMGNTTCWMGDADLKMNRHVESRYIFCKFSLCLSRQSSNQKKCEVRPVQTNVSLLTKSMLMNIKEKIRSRLISCN